MQTIQNIEIFWDQKLGAGGEGEVYKGRYQGHLVAVKVPHNPGMVWQRPELRAAGRHGLEVEWNRRNLVKGDHHVKALAQGLDLPVPCLVFELAEKGSLADEMADMKRRGKVYEPLVALARVEEILCALQEAHECNIIHRDVKPANFLKFSDNKIKLNDFGLGRTADRACSLQTKYFQGTALYAAPEQLDGRCVTKRADLYAVGAILHELLFGMTPKRVPRTVVLPHRADVRVELRKFVTTLLASNPEDRFCCAPRALSELSEVRWAYDTRSLPCPRCGQFH